VRAVFLDRDGTLIIDPPDERVDSMEKIQLFADTIGALKKLAELKYGVFIVTNQAGIAEGRLSQREFQAINRKVIELFAPSGIKILGVYMCPHGPKDACACRKPKPGLLLKAALDFGVDLANSWTIGDRISDIQAGSAAGTHTILVKTARVPSEAPNATYAAPSLDDAISFIAARSAQNR